MIDREGVVHLAQHGLVMHPTSCLVVSGGISPCCYSTASWLIGLACIDLQYVVVIWDLNHSRLSLSLLSLPQFLVVVISFCLSRVDNLPAQVISVLAQRAMCLREVDMAGR